MKYIPHVACFNIKCMLVHNKFHQACFTQSFQKRFCLTLGFRDCCTGKMLLAAAEAVLHIYDAVSGGGGGVHGGSDLARHHSSGEQLVQLDQLVGRRVKLERDAVQRVPRFHLDHKREERRRNQRPAQQPDNNAGRRRLLQHHFKSSQKYLQFAVWSSWQEKK